VNETDFGSLFLATGGAITIGAIICLLIGTIGWGGMVAALLATYATLVLCNSLDRGEQRARR
jgi:hypothetical protein